MILKLFIQEICPKCPAAKVLAKKIEHKIKLENHNMDETEGLSEAIYYGVSSAPSIVIIDHEKNVVSKFLGEVPALEELERIIK
ncbi:MAG: thioredoxin family protein [Candidatus Woesearchaeota archaeon]